MFENKKYLKELYFIPKCDRISHAYFDSVQHRFVDFDGYNQFLVGE